MNLQHLFGLRPKNDTAVALGEAEARTRAALAAATARVAEIEATRTDILLTGAADQVTRAEADLAAARAEVERVTIMLAELGKRRAVAEREEALAELRRELAEAEAESRAVADILRREYPRLAKELRALLERECAAINRCRALSMRLGGNPIVEQEGLKFPDPPECHYWTDGGIQRIALSLRVKLPPLGGVGEGFEGGFSHWPPPRPSTWGGFEAPWAGV